MKTPKQIKQLKRLKALLVMHENEPLKVKSLKKQIKHFENE